eukprot:Pgem_evm1s15152
MKEVFKYWNLDNSTQEFIGHAACLYTNDDYKLVKGYGEVIKRMKLYAISLSLYKTSPYLYPLYGLGDLPQGFARLSAVYGGTFMLRRPIDEVVYDDTGVAIGVKMTIGEGDKAESR